MSTLEGDDGSEGVDVEGLLNEPARADQELVEMIEEDCPNLQERHGHIVVPGTEDDVEHKPCDLKCLHDVLHDIEGSGGEMKTLELTEKMSRVRL